MGTLDLFGADRTVVKGKGFYIWQIPNCEKGDAAAILAEAQRANLSHVLVKVADGVNSYNYDSANNIDLAAQVVRKFKKNGISVWGWQYIYGREPKNEANKAIQRINELALDGFVVNAEVEFKQTGMDVKANTYMSELRNKLPQLPLALSSYRFPSYHPQFPFAVFLKYCNINMPQVYWQGSHNPAAQLTRSVYEFQSISPFRPVIPTGSAYSYGSWQPTRDDIRSFLSTAKTMGLSAANFWSWDYSRKYLPHLWDEASSFSWASGVPEPDLVEEYITALNAHDPVALTMLYNNDGVHINAERSIQGHEKILVWYNSFLNQSFPNGVFKMTGYTGVANSRHLSWEATSPSGKIRDAKDTFGLRNGKIAYHYSYYKIDLN